MCSEKKSSPAYLTYKRLPEPEQILTGALLPHSLLSLPTPRVEILAWKVDQWTRKPCIPLRWHCGEEAEHPLYWIFWCCSPIEPE